ncbi:4,5:9,10-diseco-3-hydroxy-5,9,17-trioxoandrosta-1(10),2-diene-4-oate hydrolase [Nocardia cerradoensis]|uniref:4,5:9,10-diseco-3-hydroxy-5,9, 17-trioxoandrosta-1(10),2-diene-4-oate hydrolase n=1 Tax=Nocardia cerradoensis TaxID=85688 RepID=A0A231HGH9_9NOCA|nr:alpha/beta fold hydrolase [Nocardia cerradoensis]OXR47817.1 4,5:9,10-diseco-3-hydroxy-5,9,17-trioxoandrosta-1(10),2-diene-4-oate hydrolase [Nocardia cerradoensis]
MTSVDTRSVPELLELPTEHGVLRYRDTGEGPPLLMLHGSGPGVTGWRNFSGNVPTFARHYRTLVLEFPGFGVSDDFGAAHPMMSAQLAVTAFLDGLGLESVRIIGNSMGGFVATEFALAAPQRVDRLVTIGGIGTNIFSPQPGEGIIRLSEFVENPTRDSLVAWLRSMVYDQALLTEELIEQRWEQATEPGVLENSRRMYGRAALARMAEAARAADVTPGWANLRRISVPTLITWGRDDRVSPVDMSLIAMRTLPHGEVHIFPNCGHWVMIEQKQAWEATVSAFLTR